MYAKHRLLVMGPMLTNSTKNSTYTPTTGSQQESRAFHASILSSFSMSFSDDNTDILLLLYNNNIHKKVTIQTTVYY